MLRQVKIFAVSQIQLNAWMSCVQCVSFVCFLVCFSGLLTLGLDQHHTFWKVQSQESSSNYYYPWQHYRLSYVGTMYGLQRWQAGVIYCLLPPLPPPLLPTSRHEKLPNIKNIARVQNCPNATIWESLRLSFILLRRCKKKKRRENMLYCLMSNLFFNMKQFKVIFFQFQHFACLSISPLLFPLPLKVEILVTVSSTNTLQHITLPCPMT